MVVRALVALEPRTYREAIASALRASCPLAVISISDPEDLDLKMERLEPHVVFCSQIVQPVRDEVLCWAEVFIVGEELLTIVSVKGLASKILPDIHLAELEALIDSAEEVLAEADQQ